MSFIQMENLGEGDQPPPSLILNLNLDDLANAGRNYYDGSEGEEEPSTPGTFKKQSADAKLHEKHGTYRRPTMQRRSPRAGTTPPHMWKAMQSPRPPLTPGAGIKGSGEDPHSKRRGEISAEPFTASKSTAPYKKTLIAKAPQVKALLKNVVDTCLLFSGLTEEGKNEVVDAFERVEAKRLELLIEEGEPGDFFYVLEQGAWC